MAKYKVVIKQNMQHLYIYIHIKICTTLAWDNQDIHTITRYVSYSNDVSFLGCPVIIVLHNIITTIIV